MKPVFFKITQDARHPSSYRPHLREREFLPMIPSAQLSPVVALHPDAAEHYLALGNTPLDDIEREAILSAARCLIPWGAIVQTGAEYFAVEDEAKTAALSVIGFCKVARQSGAVEHAVKAARAAERLLCIAEHAEARKSRWRYRCAYSIAAALYTPGMKPAHLYEITSETFRTGNIGDRGKLPKTDAFMKWFSRSWPFRIRVKKGHLMSVKIA